MLHMGRRAVAMIGVVVLAAVACGGRVIDEPDPDPTGQSVPPSSTSTAKSPTGPTGSKGSDDFVGSSTTLPECKLGSPPASGTPCDFTTGDLCYETKIKACACACPRRTGTVCSSGFPNSLGRVVVSCS